MMESSALSAFLRPEDVVLGLRSPDKAHLLGELSRRVAPGCGVAAEVIETALASRERLGSTGLGDGFALPHARLAGLERPAGSFVRLARPIDFQAIDDGPVDLVFVLLVPEQDGSAQVSALAAISRTFRNPGIRDGLRRARDAAAAYALLVEL